MSISVITTPDKYSLFNTGGGATFVNPTIKEGLTVLPATTPLVGSGYGTAYLQKSGTAPLGSDTYSTLVTKILSNEWTLTTAAYLAGFTAEIDIGCSTGGYPLFYGYAFNAGTYIPTEFFTFTFEDSTTFQTPVSEYGVQCSAYRTLTGTNKYTYVFLNSGLNAIEGTFPNKKVKKIKLSALVRSQTLAPGIVSFGGNMKRIETLSDLADYTTYKTGQQRVSSSVKIKLDRTTAGYKDKLTPVITVAYTRNNASYGTITAYLGFDDANYVSLGVLPVSASGTLNIGDVTLNRNKDLYLYFVFAPNVSYPDKNYVASIGIGNTTLVHEGYDISLFTPNEILMSDYMLKSDVELNYMLKTLVASDYMLKSVVASDYMTKADVELLYMLRSIVARDYIFAFSVRNLEATYGTYSSKIVVRWDRVETATEYVIYRKGPSDVAFLEIARIPSTSTFYEDKSLLIKNTSYLYTVKAVNSNGDYSEYGTADTGSVDVVHDVTGVDATKGDFGDRIVIKWNESDGAVDYKIYRRVENTVDYELLGTVPFGTTTYIDMDGITKGTRYEYSVAAVDVFSAETVKSSTSIGYCDDILEAVTGISCTKGDYEDKVVVSWQPNHLAEEYHIFRRTFNGGVFVEVGVVSGLTFEDTSMMVGVEYLYFVIGYSATTGWTAASNPDNGYAGYLLGTSSNEAASITTYSLYTDESDVDIIFSFPVAVKTSDTVVVKAWDTKTNEEIFVAYNGIVKLFDNIISWNTSKIIVKPVVPKNILLQATISGTEKKCYAIIQYKQRYSQKDAENITRTEGAFGTLIW